MPEPWNPTDEELAYVKEVEENLGYELTSWQQVAMITMRRANKDGKQFGLGRGRKPRK